MGQDTEELRDALRHGNSCLDNHYGKIGVPPEQMATALQRLVHAAENFLKANE